MSDVGTTKRKPLTPTQRLALFERHKGICSLCGLKIRGKFIDEHMRALGLGGGNEPENRGIAHPKCADLKTRGQDMPAINKAKAQKKAALGIKAPTAKIQSPPPQPKPEKAKKNLSPLGPPRPLFRNA